MAFQSAKMFTDFKQNKLKLFDFKFATRRKHGLSCVYITMNLHSVMTATCINASTVSELIERGRSNYPHQNAPIPSSPKYTPKIDSTLIYLIRTQAPSDYTS